MAPARMRHTVDRAACRRVAAGPEVAAVLVSFRSRAASESRRIAPKGPTEMYSESIVEGPMGVEDGDLTTSYGSTDFAAHIVEFGSVKNQPYRVLHRAAQALGLKVEDGR